MISGADVGGTDTRIGFFEEGAGRVQLVVEKIYSSREHESLDQIVALFLRDQGTTVKAACFGIAGPVQHGKVAASNLPWVVDAARLSRQIGIRNAWLINDLEAHASGIGDLDPNDFIHLNALELSDGNAALIAAGTGLGEAGLYW